MSKLTTKPEPTSTRIPDQKAKYRYFCDACTGTAFFASEFDIMPRTAVCRSCGKKIEHLHIENYIKI
jgi:hypothetical protein